MHVEFLIRNVQQNYVRPHIVVPLIAYQASNTQYSTARKWKVRRMDGHDNGLVDDALVASSNLGQPTLQKQFSRIQKKEDEQTELPNHRT